MPAWLWPFSWATSCIRGLAGSISTAFFGATSAFLIVIAAGLLAHGIHEFEEAGLIPILVEHLWNTNAILPEQSDLGRFLTALFGYNGNPSLVEVLGYVGYLAAGLWYYFRPGSGSFRQAGPAEDRSAETARSAV